MIAIQPANQLEGKLSSNEGTSKEIRLAAGFRQESSFLPEALLFGWLSGSEQVAHFTLSPPKAPSAPKVPYLRISLYPFLFVAYHVCVHRV